MADSRNIVTAASVAVALIAGAWAIYATHRAGQSDRLNAAEGAQVTGSGRSDRPSGASGAGPGTAVASERVRSGAGGPVAVITAPARAERLSSQISALGTAHANEAVEVTSKSSNTITSVRFSDGSR